MKQILITGTTMALSLSAGAAVQAGPTLEAMLGHLGDEISYTAGSEEMQGDVEIYRDLALMSPELSEPFSLRALAIQEKEGQFLFSFKDGSFPEGKTLVEAEEFAMTVTPEAIKYINLDDFLEDGILTPEMCQKIDSELVLDITGLKVSEAGVTVSSLEHMRLNWDIQKPKTHCVMDMQFSLTEAQIMPDPGSSVKIKTTDFEMFAPISDMINSGPGFETYSSRMDMVGIDVAYGGETQVSIGNISSHSSLDSASFQDLMAAGYTGFMQEMSALMIGFGDVKFKDYSPSELWNGMQASAWSAGFGVSEVQIVGPMLLMLTGLEVLEPGRTLDLGIDVEKNAAGITYEMQTLSPELIKAGIKVDIGMDTMDASADDMSRDQLMMSLPVTLDGMKIKLHDMGVSDLTASVTGAGLPQSAKDMIAPFLGGVKAKMVSDWLRQAQEQEMVLEAKPANGLSVPILIGGAMGDWNTFGQMLGVR